jgi:hypothetical protein
MIGFITLSRQHVLSVGCAAWNEVASKRHISAGFATGGLFPLSLEAMRARLRVYQDNGVKDRATKALWLKHREAMREDVLYLPPKRTTVKRKRKTIDVAGKLLTVALLDEIEKQEAEAAKTRHSKKQRTQ